MISGYLEQVEILILGSWDIFWIFGILDHIWDSTQSEWGDDSQRQQAVVAADMAAVWQKLSVISAGKAT